MITSDQEVPWAFISKRLHSLAGLWLVGYIIVHLFTNSQAALFIGDDGKGFIHSVNSIHELPYLPVIEIAFLGIPILIHALWGIQYALNAKYNSFGNAGNEPYLPEYPRNKAYTWQRLTSWFLVVGILAHVIHMRFIEYPVSTQIIDQHAYMMRVSLDDGLYTLAPRLGAELYDQQQIQALLADFDRTKSTTDKVLKGWVDSLPKIFKDSKPESASAHLLEEQYQSQYRKWLQALQKRPLKKGEVIAVANNFGTVELLMLRDTFKSPLMIALYTLLVLTACFHAFNGLWTAMITWGVTLSQKSQKAMSAISVFLMVAVSLLGLSAIWLTYWINLKQ